VGTIVVEIADAGVGDVESAVAESREIQRPGHDVDDLWIDLDGSLRRMRIDGRKLALRLVRAHQLVGAAHLGDHCIHGARGEVRVLGPELHGDPRAHDRLLAVEPLGVRLRSEERQRDRDEQETRHRQDTPLGSDSGRRQD
jgi:hypothetical protein